MICIKTELWTSNMDFFVCFLRWEFQAMKEENGLPLNFSYFHWTWYVEYVIWDWAENMGASGMCAIVHDPHAKEKKVIQS